MHRTAAGREPPSDAEGAYPLPDRDERLEVLRKIGLFEGLTGPELERIATLLRRRRYKKGMFIFLEGEPIEAVHFVESGCVKASTTDAEGKEHILNVLGPGDFFPHVAFLDGGPAPGTAQALEETTLWVIERAAFYRLLTQAPELAVRLVAILGSQIRRLHTQLRELGTQAVPARLAQVLARLCRQHGVPEPQPDAPRAVRIPLHLSHQDLAAMAGTTRETVSRLLSAFRRAGLIRVEQGRVIVTDPGRLDEWA